MANDAGRSVADGSQLDNHPSLQPAPLRSAGWRALAALSSLQVTVVFLAAAIVLIFVGTLAQYYMDMWEVIEKYFRAWICWVDIKVLFPPSFFPWAADTDWNRWAIQSFPFPGGALIGLGLVINLTAAHIVRFRLQVRGIRLVAGLALLVVGILTTWLIIESGHNRHGLQGKPWLEWTTLWQVVQGCVVALTLACFSAFCYAMKVMDRQRRVERWFLGISSLGLMLFTVWMFTGGEAFALNTSSLRILYQLIQAELAAVVLLIACVLLFQNRAGLALLHGGVGLMMFGEFFVSYFATEQQMVIPEGQAVSFAQDTRTLELAVLDAARGDGEGGVGIPMSIHGKLTRYAQGDAVKLADLPFEIKVIRFYKNSRMREVKPEDQNPATAGFGTRFMAIEEPPAGGVKRGATDRASAYVQYTRKDNGEDLGTYLHSQWFAGGIMGDRLAVDKKLYSLGLRYEREYKPYTIELLDVRKDDYVGTKIARNYSSLIRLKDAERNVEFETKIWMNNPLRYAGETFYQSGYNKDRNGKEVTVFQIVRNTGWMIPYVACMIVATGMLAHFFVVLLHFLRRIQGAPVTGDVPIPAGIPAPVIAAKQGPGPKRSEVARWIRILVPSLAVLLGVLWVGSKAIPRRAPAGEMQLDEFAEIPVMFEGRVKPLGTLARNSLRIISNRETFVDSEGLKRPAIRWLLDVIARPKVAESHPVFRIDSHEVLDSLGLERRQGSRYAFQEILPRISEFQRQVGLALRQPAEKRSFQQRKLLDLKQRIDRYQLLADAFRPLPFPPFPDPEETKKDPIESMKAVRKISQLLKQVPFKRQSLAGRQPPLAVPGPADEPWQAYATAKNSAYADQQMRGKTPPPLIGKLSAVFDAYAASDAASFNRAVRDYRSALKAAKPVGYDPDVNHLEAYFNVAAPFYNLIPLYFFALILTVAGWLVAAASRRVSDLIRSSAFWLILLTLVIHTLALAGRVIISGRPPVTNLYSSAVFIGWSCVILGLILEMFFRYGVGNCAAAVVGIGTLIIAHFLAGDGDTIRVLQAVLDTQFWLTVHVLTVTLGYSAAFLAGTLALLSMAIMVVQQLARAAGMRWARFGAPGSPQQRPWSEPSNLENVLASMIYGTICFAAFASFVGTVLGGLWADDSWGRFWGWDPKENGALMIVLWTALMLHARWVHLVGARGMALLAIGGNIVTAWSWFGVNELGVGLHTYGFTEGVARVLLIFWLSQLAIIGAGILLVLAAHLADRRSGATADASGG